jgi:transmembrane sensor
MKRGPDSSAQGGIEAAAARWVARRDAGLSPAGERELQRWIDADPRHRAALAFYDSAWAALARPSHSGAGGELEAQLTMMQGRRRRRRISVGGAAAVVLLSITAVMWDRAPASFEALPTAVVLVPPRQALPDGSFVELKGNARIAVEYTSNLRRVVLVQGEAYFSVQEDPARPFIVLAGEIEVRAVGTAFSVQRKCDGRGGARHRRTGRRGEITANWTGRCGARVDSSHDTRRGKTRGDGFCAFRLHPGSERRAGDGVG